MGNGNLRIRQAIRLHHYDRGSFSDDARDRVLVTGVQCCDCCLLAILSFLVLEGGTLSRERL